MPIDHENRPYYETQQCQLPYTKSESVKLEDGSYGTRTVTVTPEPLVHREYDLSKLGWFKKLTFREVHLKEVWKPIPDTEDFERTTALVLTTYEVDVSKAKCLSCEQNNEDYDFIKKASSLGLVRRCFKTDRTTGFLGKSTAKAFKFVSEKRITTKQAYELIMSGEAYCESRSLCKQLGIPDNF